jgi:hypothetical protein
MQRLAVVTPQFKLQMEKLVQLLENCQANLAERLDGRVQLPVLALLRNKPVR